jgi:ATP phosphoribosyltransferase regulatory subunit
MDLRQLHGLLAKNLQPKSIRAPHRREAGLDEAIGKLREQGQAVVVDLLGKSEYLTELNCDRELVLHDGKWVVVAMKN